MEEEKSSVRKVPVSDDQGDTSYGSDFAFRMNQLNEKAWKRYCGGFGTLIGLLMGVILFAVPASLIGDSVRLLLAFMLGMLPIRFFEKAAERNIKFAKVCMAIAFCLCMAVFAGYLLLKGTPLSQ